MKKTKLPPSTIVNRRAKFDYTLSDEIIAGMSLLGPEVRAIRDHHTSLQGTFVTIKNRELWLNNLSLNNEPTRNIRLLITKQQINNFIKQKDLGFTIIPTKLISNGKHIKLAIALAKGKKSYDKRQTIKNRDLDRESKKFKY